MGNGGLCCFFPLGLAGGWHDASPLRVPMSMAWFNLVSFASAKGRVGSPDLALVLAGFALGHALHGGLAAAPESWACARGLRP